MRPCATAQPRNSAQGVHIASGVVQIQITGNRTWDVSCRSTRAVEPAGAPLARTAGRPIDSLAALGTGYLPWGPWIEPPLTQLLLVASHTCRLSSA